MPSHASIVLDDGTDLAYSTYGDPDGSPLVFHHGTPGCHELGALLDTPARQAGVRVVAPSRPGSGPSDPVPGATIADWPETCREVVDALDIGRFALAGFSGGCPFAARVAATLSDRVTGLGLVGGPVPDSESGPFGFLTATPGILGLALRGVGWYAGRRGDGVVTANLTERDLPDDVASIVASDFRRSVAGDASGPVRETRLLDGDWALPDVTVQTVVYHGREDANVPPDPVLDYWSGRDDVRMELGDTDHLGTLLSVRDALLTALSAGR